MVAGFQRLGVRKYTHTLINRVAVYVCVFLVRKGQCRPQQYPTSGAVYASRLVWRIDRTWDEFFRQLRAKIEADYRRWYGDDAEELGVAERR